MIQYINNVHRLQCAGMHKHSCIHTYVLLSYNMYTGLQCSGVCIVSYMYMNRVGQNHKYTVYIRYFWQGNHQIYGHIYTVNIYGSGQPYT